MKKWIWLLLVLFITVSAYKVNEIGGEWKLITSTNTPGARNECGLATVNGKLYLFGGDGPAMPVEIYDPVTSTWTEGAQAPVIMHHFQAIGYGDKVYVLDAFSDRNYPNQIPLANSYSYNTKANTWEQLAGLPEGRRRAGAGAAVYQGKFYLVCGIQHGHSSGTTNMFDVYDPAKNTWTALPDAPHIRDHSMAVVVKDKLYAVGGRNTSLHDADNFMSFFDKVVLDVDCYDFKTGKWSTVAARLPLGTGGGTCVNLDDKIFYIGGERATATKPNGPQKDVFYLDPESGNQWAAAPSLNKARNGVGGAVLNHKIYIAGGAGGDIGLEAFSWK
jgi:N-acetylneuraminic acid mutarotase